MTFDDLNLDPERPLDQQIWDLKEDLLQVTYRGGKYLIDVGWYPDLSVDGSFKAVVIRDGDWEHPLFKEHCKTLEALRELLNSCVDVVNRAQMDD